MKEKDAFPGWQLRLAGAILVRPDLWRTCLIQMWRLIPSIRFGKKTLELQSSFGDYLKMRTEISHGDANEPTRARDIMEWLVWCRQQLSYK